MIKVFLSHSSKQKDIVLEVSKKIGLNFSIVDKYTFEDGSNLQDEINTAIHSSQIFALFLSKEAFKSDWVRKELKEVRDMVDEKRIGFCAFLIGDAPMNIDSLKKDSDFRWVTNYILHAQGSTTIMARNLRRRVRELIWTMSDANEAKERLFIGRSRDVDQIEKKMYESVSVTRKALIVSGFPSVGRKRLLKEILVTKMKTHLHSSYEPFMVKLGETDSIEDLAMQLNELLQKFTPEELIDHLQVGANRKDVVVEMLNDLTDVKEVVLIDDTKCVVTPNGGLADWFVDIVQHEKLENDTRLLVASRCSLRYTEEMNYPQIQSLLVNPLDKESMLTLFNAYSRLMGVQCTADDTKEFLHTMTGHPDEVYWVIDEIVKKGLHSAKMHTRNFMMMYDRDMGSIWTAYNDNHNARQLMVLMSKFEFISYGLICQLYKEDDLDVILEDFSNLALYETFGPSRQFLRLNLTLSDFINRSKFPLDQKYQEALSNFAREMTETNDEDLDLAEQLYKIKESIKNNSYNVNSKYFLPSFVLKVIVDEYHKGDYPAVIDLADRIINDFQRNNYDTIQYTIRYWLCLALCHETNQRLLEEVKYFTNSYTHNFLLGYYYRNKRDYPKAEKYYRQAVGASSAAKKEFKSKAEHELSIVLMKNGNYKDAFDFAQSSYMRFPTNPYHIETYYHCLVRMPHPDYTELQSLHEAMMNSYDANREIIAHVFDMEKLYYVDGNFVDAVAGLKQVLEIGYPREDVSSAIDALRDICKTRSAESMYVGIIRKCGY